METNILKHAKEYVNMLLTPLDKHYYHSYLHAIDVMQRAVYLAEKENLSVSEIEMLALAGLFHDTGFVVRYDKNEPIGAKIAKIFLQKAGYDKDKIKLIEEIILATDVTYTTPKNIYEKIIKDADMDNLGRDDFCHKSHDIQKEIETIKKIKLKDVDWHHSILDLVEKHEFYTETQRVERNRKKQENIEKLINKLKKEEKLKAKK